MSNTYIHDLPPVSPDSNALIPVDVPQANGEFVTGYVSIADVISTINSLKFNSGYTLSNTTSAITPTIGGNTASGTYSTIAGGTLNNVISSYNFLGNGNQNIINGSYSSLINGAYNVISGNNCFISGINNSVVGNGLTVLGGSNNTLSGINCFAFGSSISAIALDTTFVNNLSATGTIYGDVNSFITITDYAVDFPVDDGDNGTIINVDTTNGDVYATFQDNLTEGLNVTLNNVGTNSIQLSSLSYPISSASLVVSNQYSAVYVYLHNSALYVINR
jgi:hypothetical protein